MRLLIIRHGDPDYEHNDLTPAGKVEAELLVPRLQREEITEFYSSPLGRAKATARPTLEALGRDYSFVPWDWLPADWLQDPRLLDRERWRENEIMAAEDVGRKYDRVTAEFDKLLEAHGYRRNGLLYDAVQPNADTLAFFCHFGLGCVLLSHLMNCSPMVLWQGMCMPPSSVTTVYTEERRPGTAVFRTLSMGDISHLYAAEVQPTFAARFCEVYGDGSRID